MLTGTLKSKIDAIRQDFYNDNMAQSSDVVNQLTTLMFIKMLDDKQNAIEASASLIGVSPNEEDLVFKSGDYSYYELINGEKKLKFNIPYEKLRWKNFKNLNSMELARTIKEYVIPFVKDPDNKAIGQFGKYAKKYAFGFDDKERLLTSVVDKLSDDDFDFNKTDLMGDAYEYICGSGISGQYRTPRHIIDMAVEMMKPRLGEKIIDPAMGTAGFLIESAKYIKTHQHDELLNVENGKLFNNSTFYGCDNDPNMARIGYMNAILHDIKNPIFSMDSLLENENAKDYLGKFDLVLANPPFSGSLVESATSGKVLAITKTKETELLFVALMDLLLKVGGRCMTIVPDGVLFRSNKAYKQLRIELIDKQKLIGVVSMPKGIFLAPSKKGSSSKGAGVQTAFLIFQKTNNGGTDKVWFYNMTDDGFTLDVKRTPTEKSDIPDIVNRFNNLDAENARTRKDKSFFVPVDEIRANDYDLTINTYREIEREKKVYRKTTDIISDIEQQNDEENGLLVELKNMLGSDGDE
ncbi:MAG: N-6 DNA methylase [Sphaerochaetaceae bacterium]|nr:N-6 DNA methylase [Sphaerochaetaceae bacterium]